MRARFLTLLLTLIAARSFGAIVGTVMNRDGQPLAGASVAIFPLESTDARRARLISGTEVPPLASVQSDAKGNFTIPSPKDAVVDLRVTANGFAPDGMRVEREDDAGGIALTAASIVKGTVKAAGKAVEGARVTWMSGANIVTATTDAEGKYTVADPSLWANRVVVVHPDLAISEEGFGGMFRDNAKVSLDRNLDTGVALSGRATTADGQTPVPEATVLVDGWPLASTGDDGNYTIAHAPKKWAQLALRTDTLFGVYARKGDAPATIRLARPATLSGSVRDAKTQAAVPGAEIRLTPPGRFDTTVSKSVLADAKGNYALAAIEPGIYALALIHPGYSGSPSTVTVLAGQKASKNLSAAPRARISGTVTDDERRPVAAASVATRAASREDFRMMMGPPAQRVSARSAPDGRFTIRVPASESEMHVTATKAGFPAGTSAAFRLTPGERKSGVMITIPRGLTLTGRVTDRDGKPLSGVSVQAGEMAPGPAGPGRRVIIGGDRERDPDLVRTTSDGAFTLRLKEGRYDIAFQREGFAPKTARAVEVSPAAKPLTIVLEPGVEIAGRVVRGGAGVEGVRINVMRQEGMPVFTTTGFDGSFRLSDLTPGMAMMMVTKDEEFIEERRSVNAPAQDLVIEIPAGGRVMGRVVDKTTKRPITAFQAGVNVSRSGGGMMFVRPPQLRSFTADDGTFVLENVPTGPTEIVASAPGYVTGRAPNIDVEDGKTVRDVEIELDHGVRLTGRVTSPSGTPVANASVAPMFGRGRATRPPGPENFTTTDAAGEYTLESLEPGERSFTFDASGFIATQKTVDLSGQEVRLDVQLSSGMRVTGVVVNEAGAAVAEARVRIDGGGDMSSGSVTTDANGNFNFEAMAPGRYTFTASKAEYATGIARDVDITTGAPVRVTLTTGGTIYGHVRGLSDSELVKATVLASSPSGRSRAPVDYAGNFRIEGSPVGTVRVAAEVGGIGGGRTSAAQSVQVEPGSSVNVDIDFKSDTSVRGRVTRNGVPLVGAMVNFAPREARAQTASSTPTDESGSYTATGLEDGLYNVRVVDMKRMATYGSTYEVRGSGTYDIDVKPTTLRGRVLDAATDEPIAEAIVRVRPEATDPMSMRMVSTDSTGAFLIEDITAGRYHATVEKEGYGSGVADIIIEENNTEPLEMKLSKNSGVTMKVVDARDGRDLDATIEVRDAQNRIVYDDPFRFGPGSTGALRLPLAPGQYRAIIFASGYATRSLTVVSPSQPTIGLTPGGTLVIKSSRSALQRARLVDGAGQGVYVRFRSTYFTIDGSPGVTTLQNVAPGTYTLQVLSTGDVVLSSTQVTVVEGQSVEVGM